MKQLRIYKNQVVVSGSYFIFFATRYKRRLFDETYAPCLKQVITDVCEKESVELLALTIYPDAVQMRVCVDPSFGINRFVRLVKRTATSVFTSNYPELFKRVPNLWHSSYLVVLSEQVPEALICQYMQSLSSSQRTKSLNEENLKNTVLPKDDE